MSAAQESADGPSAVPSYTTDDGGPLGYRRIGIITLLGVVVLTAVPWLGSASQVAVTALLSVAFGFSWPWFLGIPARKTLGSIIAISGVLSALLAVMAPAPARAAWTAPVIAGGVMAVILVQLIRGTGQPHRLESTFGASSGVLLASLASGWVANVAGGGLRDVFLVMSACAVVAILVGLIGWPDSIVAPLGLVLSALVGPLVAWFNPDINVLPSIITGLAAGALMLSFRRLLVLRDRGVGYAGALGIGLAPALALGTVAYFLDRLLVL